jgi:tetratricopeptide (TPR) repeat protein
LIVGELGWPLLADGKPSRSLRLAKTYAVAIASERRFLEWTGRAAPDQQIKTYSASQIASLSGLPPELIEELTLFGLLDARDKRYGFRDLAAARQLAELFAAGVTLSTITRSLFEIRKWLPEAGLSNLRLFPSSADALLIEQMKGLSEETGQFVLSVKGPPENADELFERAQVAEGTNDFESAERLYRKVMRIDPSDPTARFNLGNLLRKTGRKIEAEAAYRTAVKADPRFAEAWYNLADLLDDQNQPENAAACLERALETDPAYADALFNLGLLLQRLGRHADAVRCWRRYLALDADSSWAARARRALKYCEMQMMSSVTSS